MEERTKLLDFLHFPDDSGVAEILEKAKPIDKPLGGRPEINRFDLFATILYGFAFGSGTLRDPEDACKFDLRYIYLMRGEQPSYVVFGNYITDVILPEVEQWRSRPLKKCYAFLFVDCMYVSVRSDYEAREQAVYTILGYDLKGEKEILGLWMGASESKNYWMQVFDEIKGRGVEDVFFISMDGVSGLEDGAKAIFPGVVVQRCIVHLIRNSIKYVPSKDYKKYTSDLKKVYGAPSLKAAKTAFETFQNNWKQYPGAVDVWARNFLHVEQLFDYRSAVRKVMYTTNAIEAINSSFRKVTKKGSFPNENAVYKLLYLRITELEKKWEGDNYQNWSMVLNQLMVNEKFTSRIEKYLVY